MPTIRIAGVGGKGAALTPTEADSNMKRTPVAKSSNYTLDATHNLEIHELGGTVSTVTLPSVSSSFTETDDWRVTLVNTLSTAVTVARNSQTIDGASSDYTLRPYERRTFWMNSTFDGFWTDFDKEYYACRAYKSSNQSVTSTVWTDLTFGSESFDSGAIHSTASNTELFAAPAWATKARIVSQLAFDSNATGARGARIVTSAGALLTPHIATIVATVTTVGVGTYLQFDSGLFPVTGGASYKVQVYQTSGGALNVLGSANETWASIEFMA